MKKVIAVLSLSVALSGCGLSVVKKDNLLGALADVNEAITRVQADICTQEGQANIDAANSTVKVLIDKYGK